MIKTLAGCIGKYKKDSIIAPLFVILEVLGEICIPFLVSNLIDYGIDKGNMDYIFKIGSILVLCTILTLICSFIAGRSAAIASCGFARNIRQAMYAKVQNFSFFNATYPHSQVVLLFSFSIFLSCIYLVYISIS